MIKEKRLKKIIIYFEVFSVVFMCWGCGKKENKEISEDRLLGMVAELVNCDGFESKLELVDETIVLNSYKISDADISVVAGYIGEGASAEEVTLFKCSDTDKIKDYTGQYLKDKEENYKGYLPKEADKIGKAIIKEYKGYVLVCVSNNEKTTKDIIEKVEAN